MKVRVKLSRYILFTAIAIVLGGITYAGTSALAAEGSSVTKKRSLYESHEVLGTSTSKVFEREVQSANLSAPVVVTIIADGSSEKILTPYPTVSEIVQDKPFEPDEDDHIIPEPTSPVSNGATITITRVGYTYREVSEPIPYSTIIMDNDQVELGIQQVTQNGINGEKKLVYRAKYEDGILINEELVDTYIAKKPQDHVVSKGTKLIRRTVLTESGEVFEYCSVRRMWLTAYDPFCLGCSGRGITALGAKLKKGIVAVDPKVIPLRSFIYVPGYGIGHALDVGGAVKGDHVDLGFESPEQRTQQWSGSKYGQVYMACPAS